MKLVPLPVHDDMETLDELARTNYANNLYELFQVSVSYNGYDTALGDANNINALSRLPVDFCEKFRNLYSSKRASLEYIKRMRSNDDLLCCPMCGSGDNGTLDHLLPKDVFAEFSIYSKNLVPCCHGCNNKKGTTYRNAMGGRVLHPYFDQCLEERLVYTQINANNGSYDLPFLEVVEVDQNHPMKLEIHFHMEEVVKKTRIGNKQIAIWKKIKRSPQSISRPFPTNMNELNTALDQKISDCDDEFESRNNWESMLFYGLRQNYDAKDFLLNHWRSKRLI